MSYSKAKPFTPKEAFSKGYIDNATNLYLNDGASPYLRNARLDGQAIVIRPGHSLLSTLTAGDYPRGIGSYLRTNSANDRLIVRHNTDATHKLYTITEAGVATSIATAGNISSDNRMFFQNINDVVYCMNGSDDFGKLSGTTYTLPVTGVANFAPSFSVVFNGSHWASGWSTNANQVYKSVADDYEDFNSAGADQFTFSETITGLSANLQALFYFTKNTISVTGIGDITDTAGTITYTTRALEVKEGAVNNASIVEAGNKTYYLTPSNKFNILTRGQTVDGYEALELSERKYKGITKITSTLDEDQTDSFGYFLPKENIIKWFVKTKNASFNDLCIVYDISKDAFLIDTQKYFYDGVNFKGFNYTISNIEPKVYKDEINQDDEDTPIPFEYWTKEFFINDPTYKKILRETRLLLDINELASLTQTIYADGGLIDTKTIDDDNIIVSPSGIGVAEIGTYALGTGGLENDGDDYEETYILRTKGNLNKIGKKFQFKYTNGTVGGKVRLKDLFMLYEQKPAISTSLTI